jgi:hypothetical protein
LPLLLAIRRVVAISCESKSSARASGIEQDHRAQHFARLHPDALESIFWSKDDGAVIVEEWTMGFLDGMQLRLKQWVPLLKPVKQGVLIFPIAMHWFDKDGKNVQEPNVDDIDKLLDDAPNLIRRAVINIHAYWRARRGRAMTH